MLSCWIIYSGGTPFKLAFQIADEMRFTGAMIASNNNHAMFIVRIINQLLENLIFAHQLCWGRHFPLFVVTTTEKFKRREWHVSRHEIGIFSSHIICFNRIPFHYRTILFPFHELIASFTEMCVNPLMGSPST